MDKISLSSLSKHFKNIGWSLFNTYGTSIVSFIFVVLLTRLVAPETFGLVAKFISIILVVNVIVEAGKTTDLSRKKHLLKEDLDYAMLWIFFRGIIALILYNIFIIYFFADELQYFESFLLSLILISSSMQSIPVMLLIRHKEFKIKAIISIASSIFSGIISISLALVDLEFYALVFSQLVNGILLAVLSYKYSNYKFFPLKLPLKKIEVFSKGNSYFIMLTNFADRSIQAVVYNIIGKIYGIESLGYITRADTLKNATSTTLSKAVNRVAYSHNVDLFHKTNKRPLKSHFFFILIFSFFSLPLIFIASLFSDNIILFLFGKNWILVAQYLIPVLCFGYLLSLINFNNSFLISIGFLKAPLAFNIMIITFIGIAYNFIDFVNLVEFFWILVSTSFLVLLLSNFFLFYICRERNLL